MKTALLLLITLLWVGCATPTPYQPAERAGGKGYRSHKLDDNKYRISFKGNRVTERETVETYLLYLAAELTIEAGFTHFSLKNMNMDRKTDYNVAAPAVYGFMPNPALFPYAVYGMPQAPAPTRTERTEYEAVAYLHMIKAKNKEDHSQVFNAKQLSENLRPFVVKP